MKLELPVYIGLCLWGRRSVYLPNAHSSILTSTAFYPGLIYAQDRNSASGSFLVDLGRRLGPLKHICIHTIVAPPATSSSCHAINRKPAKRKHMPANQWSCLVPPGPSSNSQYRVDAGTTNKSYVRLHLWQKAVLIHSQE